MGKNQISSFACNTIKTFSNNDKWKEQRDVNQLHLRERRKRLLIFTKINKNFSGGFSHHHLAWHSLGTSHQHVLISLSFPLSVNLECNSCLQSVSDLWQFWPKPSPRFSTRAFRWQPLPAWLLLSSSRGLYAVDTDIRSPPLKPETAADMSAPLSSPDQFAFRLT